MEWQDGGESRDIEDRRSQSGGGGFGGGLNPLMFLGLLRGGPIGIGIFILIVLFTVFRGHHFPSSNNSSPAPRAAVVGPASQQRDVQLISYVLVWALVRDWKYAFALWAGIRVFALWVNLIQNYWTHDRRFGTRRYDDPGDNAMNIGQWLPVMATFSACLQNNHHHYPHLLRLSHDEKEFDFGFKTVKAMAALGLVKPSRTGNVKPADLSQLELSL